MSNICVVLHEKREGDKCNIHKKCMRTSHICYVLYIRWEGNPFIYVYVLYIRIEWEPIIFIYVIHEK